MLTWLRSRPAGSRRAARPAQTPIPVPKKRAASSPAEEEMPPPFFADSDPAFLDLGDERLTPPPLPQTIKPVVAPPVMSKAQLAQAVLTVPSFPDRRNVDRMRQLLDIFRSLDRLAAAACDGSETATTDR